MEKLKNDFKISFTKGDTYALAVKFKNITEDLRLACFSVKENPDDSPLIQKTLGTGIDKIDDRVYKNEKTYKVQLQAFDTVNLEADVQYLYDLQVTVGNVVKTVLSGVFVVNHTISGTSAVTTQELEVAVDDELETEVSTTSATNGVEYEQDPIACSKIGDMATLETANKNTIVKAINEVRANATNDIREKATYKTKEFSTNSTIIDLFYWLYENKNKILFIEFLEDYTMICNENSILYTLSNDTMETLANTSIKFLKNERLYLKLNYIDEFTDNTYCIQFFGHNNRTFNITNSFDSTTFGNGYNIVNNGGALNLSYIEYETQEFPKIKVYYLE